MKKSLLALSLVGVLFSCKKDIEQKSYEVKETIGTAYIKGNLTKATITPNLPWQPGNMTWNSNGKTAASGVNISVRINKSGYQGLYPNSDIQGTDVYTGTTDANGNFNIAVKANGREQGCDATILVESFTGTVDTVFNGTVRAGRNANYMGWSTGITVYAGQTSALNYFPCGSNQAVWSFCSGNMNYFDQNNGPLTLNTGTAVITGSLSTEIVRSSVTVVSGTASPAVNTTTNIPVPAGTKVWFRFDSDPVTYATKIYQTSTDAAGGYSFNIATVEEQTPGFNQQGYVTVSDWTGTRDTVKINSIYTGTLFVSSTTVTVPGKHGTWHATDYGSVYVGSLYNNEIRNSTNFNFSTSDFVAN